MLISAPTISPAAHAPIDLRDVSDRLARLRRDFASVDTRVVANFSAGSRSYDIPCIRFTGPYAGHDTIRLGIFAGIHGDEPAGIEGVLQFIESLVSEPQRGSGYELLLYPVVNPTGCEQRTRANFRGADLNREFWRESPQPEVRAIEAELRQHAFDGIITLHADDTSEGVYGYAHGRTLNEALLKPALLAAAQHLPLDARSTIDGFAACDGLIRDCYPCVLSAPPEQRPKPFDLIFETPGHAPFGLQVAATRAALEAIIATYPGFISYAQDL